MPGRQISEHVLALLVGLVRNVCNAPEERPNLVRFQHSAPVDKTPYKNFFLCPIEWGAEHNEIVFETRLLFVPTRGRLPILKTLMHYYVRRRINSMEQYDASATTNISLAIPSLLGSGHCKAEIVAQSLNISLKQMQRQLADEGTSFSEILEKVRENLARNYLHETDISVERIAGLLDYSATAPFTNAFQRWTKTSPLKYRRESRLSQV